MGRACYISRDAGGRIESVKAPNGKESKLFLDALKLTGDRDRAASLYGMAYSPGFKEVVGDWEAMPTEYPLDSNGEIGLDYVLDYMRYKDYLPGDLTREEVRDLGGAMSSMGVKDVDGLMDVVNGNMLVSGDIRITREGLESSGLYTVGEIDRIMSSPALQSSIASVLRRLSAYVSKRSPMSARDYHYLSADPVVDDLLVYGDGYDALGKRRRMNSLEVDHEIAKVVAGISDRKAFDAAFMGIGYGSLVDRYSNDKGFADRMYERYSGMTRTPVVDSFGNPVTDAVSEATIPYLRVTPAIGTLRTEAREIIDMDDEALVDTDDIASRLSRMAEEAADMGVDLTSLVYEGVPTVEGEALRDLMVSLDVFLSSVENREGQMDRSFLDELDTISGTGNQVMDAVKGDYGDNAVMARTGTLTPGAAYDRGLLKVGRNLYMRVNPEDTAEEMYDAMSEASRSGARILPEGVLPDNVGSMDIADIRDRIRRYVMGFVSSANTERMVLAKLAFGLSPALPRETVNMDREFRRYVASLRRGNDLMSDVMELRRIQIREKAKGSDLYRNVLRFLRFGPDYTITLTNDDPVTLRNIELSLPEGKVRDTLYDYAMIANDSSMSGLFYLDGNGMNNASVGFRRSLYANHPGLLNEPTGSVERMDDDVVLIKGSFDNFVARDNYLMEKVGESSDGSYYTSMGLLRYSDAAVFEDNVPPITEGLTTFSDTRPMSSISDSPTYELINNAYTRDNAKLMEDLTC